MNVRKKYVVPRSLVKVVDVEAAVEIVTKVVSQPAVWIGVKNK